MSSDVLSKFKKDDDGGLRNERLEYERQKQAIWRAKSSEGGKKSAAIRSLSKGGSTTVVVKPQPKPNTPSPSPSPSPLSDPATDLHSPFVKGTGKRSTLPDADWLSSLKSNPAYSGIDVDRELGRMQAWASEKGKVPSRARFLNWLNRAERPMAVNGNGAHKPLSMFELKTILQAKEVQAQELKGRYSSEAAMGTTWTHPEQRVKWYELRKEIKELTNKIASYATH